MTLTADEITSKNYDLLMSLLCQWGSSDVWHMVKSAEQCDISMYELNDILHEQAENFFINLYDEHTDVNALLNDYILGQARNNIQELVDIDIVDDYNVYYFENYLDCPLQYTTEVREIIEDAIKEKELTRDDFDKYALYLLDEMNVNFDYETKTTEKSEDE